MAKYSSTIQYNIKTNLDAGGFSQLLSQVEAVDSALTRLASKQIIPQSQIDSAKQQVATLSTALSRSYDSAFKTINSGKFFNILENGNTTLSKLSQSFSLVGAKGQVAFNNVVGSLSKLDTRLNSTSKTTEKIFNTIGNTVRWGVIASVFQEVMNGIHGAVTYMQDLDRSLTDIMLVSDYTKDDMREFAQYANEAAASLGNTTTAYTDAAMIFAQQGYDLENQKKLADITLKVSNVTGQEASKVSEELTSIINGYQLTVDDLSTSMDQIAKIANISAADVEELAVAASRVAATANTLGVDQAQLYSQIGTIVSVTREAPEVVGNALKTIYARLGDLKLGESLEDGTTLGSFSGALEKIGVHVMDANGDLREMGSIVEDLMVRWRDLDEAEKQATVVTLAGKFQSNRLMTLMENQDMYYDYLEQAENESLGTLDTMESEHLDSLAGKGAKLQATFEGLLTSLFNQDDFGPVLDGLTGLLGLIQNLVSAVGGGTPIITAFGAALTKAFSANIARSIANFTGNRTSGILAEQNAADSKQKLAEYAGTLGSDTETSKTIQAIDSVLGNRASMNNKQIQQWNTLVDSLVASTNDAVRAQEAYNSEVKRTIELYAAAQRESTDTIKQRYEEKGLKDVGKVVTSEAAKKNIATSVVENEEQVKLIKTIQGSSAAIEQYQANLGTLRETYQSLAAEGQISAEANSKLQESILALENAALEGTTSVDQLEEQLLQLAQATLRDRELLLEEASNPNRARTTNESMDQARERQLSTQQMAEGSGENVQQYAESIDKQVQYQNIIEIVAAVGQLAFAWQSFQSLGSLWANADMDTGEKLQQTILNLSMTVPMLVMSLSQLNKTKLTVGLVSGLTTLSAEMKSYASRTAPAVISSSNIIAQRFTTMGGAASRSAAAMGFLSNAARVGSVAISGLSKVIGALGGPIGVAMLALTAISTVISGVTTAAEEAQRKIVEDAQETQEKAQTNLDSIDNWDQLYQKYRQTGEVTEELTSASYDLSTTLGITGGSALTAAENFETLAQKIKKARDAELDAQIEASDKIIDANKDAFTGTWNNGSILKDVKDAYSNVAKTQTKESQAIIDLQDKILGGVDEKDIYAVINAIETYKQALIDLQNTGTDFQKERATAQLDELNKTLANQAEYQTIVDETQKKAEAAAQNSDFQEQISKITNLQDLIDAYANNPAIADWWRSATTEAEKYAFIAKTAAEEQAKLADAASMLDERKDLFDATKYKQADLNGATVDGKLLTTDITDIFDDSHMQLQEFLNNLKDSIKSLPEDMQIKLLATLDEDASLDEILASLNDIVNQAEDDAKIALSKSIEKMSDADFQGKIDTDVDTEELKDVMEYLEDNVDSSDKAAKGLEDYNEAIKGDVDALEDLAEAQLRYDSAVEDSVDNLDDWEDALNSKSIKKRAQAVEELENTYQDLLDLDPSVNLSDDFTGSIDNLNLLRKAINGSEEAYEELQKRAAKDIWIQAGLDPMSFDSVWKDMQAILDANSYNEIPIGATLDDMPFLQGLAEMLSEAGLTVSQIEGVLSSMGIDATVTTGEGTAVDTTTVTDLVPEITTESRTVTYPMGPGEETSTTIEIPTVRYKTVPSSIDNTKTMTGFGLQVTSSGSGQTSGGGVTVTEARKVGNMGGGSKSRGTSARPSGGSGGGGGGGGGKGKSPKGSGGGGSGSGKTYEPKKKDAKEDEIDRYERVNTLLKAIEGDFDVIAEEQDRLAGWNQVDNMNKQIGLLQRQISLHKEKLEIQKQEAKELQDELSSQYGITFDNEGFIANYAQIHQGLIDEVNNLINQYNATGTEEGQEVLEEQIDAAEKRLDKFADKYERYDELWSEELRESMKDLEDLEDQIEDLRIEAFESSTEAVNDIKDLQESLIDFNAVFSGLRKGDPFRDMATSAEKLVNYFDVAGDHLDDFYNKLYQRTKEQRDAATNDAARNWYDKQLEAITQAQNALGQGTIEAHGTGYLDMAMKNMEYMMEQIQQFQETGSSMIFGEDEGDMYEIARDVYETAAELIMDFEDEIEELHDAILDAIDDIGDRIDERRESYEQITDELDHQREILELLRGDENYYEINQLLDAQQYNYKASIGELNEQMKVLKDLQSGLVENSEEWKKVQEMIVDTQEELNDLVEASLEALAEKYENTVYAIGDKWIKGALGTDLDWMEEQWEMLNRNEDYYLDEVNASYEVDKLRRQYQQLLDDAGNDLSIQQKISSQMQEQLTYLREKEKLSEYDVAYAQAQLEILQKQIALEEAQRNKAQLKLRRDSQGNYNYVYTANPEDQEEAGQDLANAQNNAYNLSKEQMRQTQEDSLSALQDARSLIDDIWTNANLTLEEKQQRTREVIDSLNEYLAGTSEQLATSEKNIINDFLGMCELLLDENLGNTEFVRDRLSDVRQEIIDGNLAAFDEIDTRYDDSLTHWLYDIDEFTASSESMFQDLIANAEDYAAATDEVAALVEQNFDTITDAVNRAKDATDDLANSQADFIQQLKSDAGVIQNYESTMQGYINKLSDASNQMRAYQEHVNDLQNQIVDKDREIAEKDTTIQYYENGGNNGGGGGGGNAGGGGGGMDTGQIAEGIAGNIWTFGSWGDDPYRLNLMIQKFGPDQGRAIHDAVQSLFNGHPAYGYQYNPSKWASEGYGYYSQFGPDRFDTGGYTGDWGSENGKLAMLHSKELVLNDTDTQNILAAVSAVRDMALLLRTGALAGITSQFAGAGYAVTRDSSSVEQNVHITAEFPNVSDSREIEEALLGLNDRAFQYANRASLGH